MAKMPPTTPTTGAAHSTPATARAPITPTAPPIAEALAIAEARVRELEGLLREAKSAAVAAAGQSALRFEYPFIPPEQSVRFTDARAFFTYREGVIGNARRARHYSLFQGLYHGGAKLACGTPVGSTGHAIVWLLDNMRLDGE
jgi:hypothetical protein